MAAATSIIPYQPPVGLPKEQALAHAWGTIEKLAKKTSKLERDHEAARKEIHVRENTWKEVLIKNTVTLFEGMMSFGTGMGLGYVNGRSENKDHAQLYGFPVDVAMILAGHGTGLLVGHLIPDTAGYFASRGLHAIGNSAAGGVGYRIGFHKGAEAAAAKAQQQPAQANGVKGGTVYSAPR